MHPTITYLKHKNLLWQAGLSDSKQARVLTGFEEFNDVLQGGFPEYGVVDIRSQIGIGELRLLLPSTLTRQHQRPTELLSFIAPPMQINSEMLAEFGFELNSILVVQPNLTQHSLWSAEQSLKSGCCHTVIMWHKSLTVTQVKRLQMAAEKGNSLLFVLRQPMLEHISLPVSLGLQLSPSEAGIQAKITKQRGSWSNSSFDINMHTYWPEFSQKKANNILTFPSPASRTG